MTTDELILSWVQNAGDAIERRLQEQASLWVQTLNMLDQEAKYYEAGRQAGHHEALAMVRGIEHNIRTYFHDVVGSQIATRAKEAR